MHQPPPEAHERANNNLFKHPFRATSVYFCYRNKICHPSHYRDTFFLMDSDGKAHHQCFGRAYPRGTLRWFGWASSVAQWGPGRCWAMCGNGSSVLLSPSSTVTSVKGQQDLPPESLHCLDIGEVEGSPPQALLPQPFLSHDILFFYSAFSLHVAQSHPQNHWHYKKPPTVQYIPVILQSPSLQ